MAKSGTITKAITTGYQLRIQWTVGSQSVANNTSSVTVKVQLVSTGSSYTINSSATKNGSLTINGSKYSFTFSAALSGNQVKTLYTKTVTIAHAADGSKTCSFASSCGINVTLSGTYYGTITASGSGTFDTIARATTPTVSAAAVDMGESITISMPRASSGFVHTLTYKFGSASGTIGSSLGTSKAWTVPLALANQITSSTSGTCTITCATYSGSTLIGSKSVSFTARVPASVVPTFSSVAVADTQTAIYTKFGNMVQNKSKPKFTITAAGAYGSTITAYKTVFEGKTYSGATPTTTLTGSGTVTATITITDSRGRTAKTTKSFTSVAYTSPKISSFSALRCNADGTASYEGTAAKISSVFTIASVNSKNTAAYKIEQKPKSGSTWTEVTSGSSYSYNDAVITGETFSGDSAFDVRLTITDYFGSVTKMTELPTAFTLMDFNASGRSMAFGKVSQLSEGIEFGLPVYSDKGHFISSPIHLTSGTDLNSLTAVGHYTIPSTAVSATILNKPTTSTATAEITVSIAGNTAQAVQRYYIASKGDALIYQRIYYQSSWGAWVRISGNKELWAGGMYMTADHKIALAEPVIMQPSGIVLVFSRYSNGAVADTNFNSFFVPKQFVDEKRGYGNMFVMYATPTLEMCAAKYLYINNEYITGHASNNLTGTSATTGISYQNNQFVLRYVIGV